MRRTTFATVWDASLATINNALMATPATTPAPARAAEPKHVPAQPRPKWQKYGTPILVVLLAAAIVLTLTWNWNSWEGGRIEQVTDDAYVWGDITPVSTKVAGNVRDVRVSDFQPVHKGDLIVELEDERRRQEALFQTHSTAQQKLEQAVADERRFTAMLASREANLEQAKTILRSNESATEAERRTKLVLGSQEVQLIADLHAKEAALTTAQVNLGYTKIDPPADGNVGERQVRPGQLVSPGTQVIPFVSKIKLVQANYRETQLTNVKVGDPAELRIDAYPGRIFQGRVIEIAPASGSRFALLPPDSATGNFTKVVQRITVKIALDDPNTATTLRPGLSVIATVSTRR